MERQADNKKKVGTYRRVSKKRDLSPYCFKYDNLKESLRFVGALGMDQEEIKIEIQCQCEMNFRLITYY